MFKTQIYTHRGLEPAKNNFFTESSIQAFRDHLHRGFGLEADLQFTNDGIVFCHDGNLKRLTHDQDERALKNLTNDEACAAKLPNGRLGTFEELMELIDKYPYQNLAIHFKGALQNSENISCLVKHLSFYQHLFEKIFIFDAIPSTAKELKKNLPTLQIAASVAHPYDIERYQAAVEGTLLDLGEFLKFTDLFNWAWLDEWDLACRLSDGAINPNGKQLYTQEVFDILRKHHIKIALVSPELHGTSPGLMGGEAHPDAKDPATLFARIQKIVQLEPDAICTDYPEEVRGLFHSIR